LEGEKNFDLDKEKILTRRKFSFVFGVEWGEFEGIATSNSLFLFLLQRVFVEQSVFTLSFHQSFFFSFTTHNSLLEENKLMKRGPPRCLCASFFDLL